MSMFKKTAVVLVSGFLIAGAGMPARASNSGSGSGLHFVPLTKAYAAPILVSRPSQAATMLAVSRQFGSKRTL
jgi:hypothetical protein